jgi:hypothetical protein
MGVGIHKAAGSSSSSFSCLLSAVYVAGRVAALVSSELLQKALTVCSLNTIDMC